MTEHVILKLLILSISIYLIGKITRLYKVDDFSTAIITAVLLALVNIFIRPLIILLTIPLTIITLGLFMFFVNGFCLSIVSKIFPAFRIRGCITSALAAFLISILNLILESIFLPII